MKKFVSIIAFLLFVSSASADSIFVPPPITPPVAWTPTDASGAALTFTGVSAHWTQMGNMVFAYAQLTYPSTASGANALIGGLPVAVANLTDARQCSLTVSTVALANFSFIAPVQNTTTIAFFAALAGSQTTNLQLSGGVIRFLCIYPAT